MWFDKKREFLKEFLIYILDLLHQKGERVWEKKIITFRIIFFLFFAKLEQETTTLDGKLSKCHSNHNLFFIFSSYFFKRVMFMMLRVEDVDNFVVAVTVTAHLTFFFSFSFSIISLLKIQICSIFLWALSSVWFHYVKILLFHVFSPHALQIQFGILLFWGTKEYIGKRERKNLILWNIFKNISRIKIIFH